MKLDLKELMEKHKNDEGYDFEKANAELLENANKELNNIIAKKKPDTDKLREEAKGEALNEFLGKFKFESVEDFETFTKTVNAEKAEVGKELDDFKKRVEDFDKLKTEVGALGQDNELLQLGIKDDKKRKFLRYLYEMEGEDRPEFTEFVKNQIEADPALFADKKVVTGLGTKHTPESDDRPGWQKALDEKYK